MALNPIDEIHALQIQAGVLGRKAGHEFEDQITSEINALAFPLTVNEMPLGNHLWQGDPAINLLGYVASREGFRVLASASAISTGSLATSEAGKQWLNVNGAAISRCKSDLVLTLKSPSDQVKTVGISTKQCNNSTPTNAQLYFTTARGFSRLLQENGIFVSQAAVNALRQFCGDVGFRPTDAGSVAGRLVDPRRYFWEEIEATGRAEWENIFAVYQDEISRLLLQKAYLNDPFVPDYLLHKTKKASAWNSTEVAIYSIEELIALSNRYQKFAVRSYSVRKGSYKDPTGTAHLAPRFGVIQMQRGGQQQHPDQLQFNLEASYFYKIRGDF